MKKYLILFIITSLTSCSSDSNNPIITEEGDPAIVTPIEPTEIMYFPPIDNSIWETTSPETLGWNTSETENLKTFLSENNTRAFIILKDGKIVMEEYWGKTILGNADFTEDKLWYWASAGKTMTAFLTGIAQQEGLLSINDKTSDYLGVGWTSLTEDKESFITIKNQLTMTTGLDYEIDDLDCTLSSCLTYKVDAGTQWYYHNGPYTLLENVVSTASNMTYNDFTKTAVANKIGITNGDWKITADGFNNVYWSTARDAARFGLLLLNEGIWDKETILDDTVYFQDMINSSQSLNPAYGYLTWLNGKNSIIYPGFPTAFNNQLSENTPSDLYAAIGKNGQFIDVIPSQNMVVIRLGDTASDFSLVPTVFHDEMWEKINAVLP